jgi:hypothetical protein
LAGRRPINAEAFRAYSDVLGLNWQEIIAHGAIQDWGEAPEAGVFYGRTEELATLRRWIVTDKCRLVTLLGMGGIGKTALAVNLVESIQDQFQYVIWRSLRYAPPLEDLLAELSRFLSNQQQPELPSGVSARLSQLIDCLRKQRCLLVLDNFEAILHNGESLNETTPHRTGAYLAGYEAYGELLKRLGESQHQSAIAVISREKPREIASIEGKSLPVRSFQLNGLQEVEAREILRSKGLSGEEKWGALIQLYRGHPLGLNIISNVIQDLFNGDVSGYLRQKTLVMTGISDILDQQFKRLSRLEKEILYWLAIYRQPVLLSQLRADILPSVNNSQLIEVLQSLGGKSLIEKSTEPSEVLFTLQPVVMKYVNNQLVEQICEDICEEKLGILRSHIIVNAQEDTIQEFQFKPILTSVKEQLITAFRSENRVLEHLKKVLSMLQCQPPLEVGYAKDNILKLLAELEQGC